MAGPRWIAQRADRDALKVAAVREINRQVLGFYPASFIAAFALTAMFWSHGDRGALRIWLVLLASTSLLSGAALFRSLTVSTERFWLFHRCRLLVSQLPFSLSWGWLVLGPLNGSVPDTTRYTGVVVLAAVMGLVSANGDLVGFLVMQLPVAICVFIACLELGDPELAAFACFYVAVTIGANTIRMFRVWERQALLADNATMVEELEANRALLAHEARTDPLTGLDNRRQFHRVIDTRKESGDLVAVLMVDLDHFKAVNDAGGHAAGDAVLCAVAERLRSVVRPADDVARLGGDEFAVVLDRLADRREATIVAERLIEAVDRPYPFEDIDYRISASVGLAIGRGEQLFDLVAEADASLYRAKADGRGRVVAAEG